MKRGHQEGRCFRFQSGNPWLSSEFADFDSFVYVDELVGGSSWQTRFTDAEWETK